MLLWFIGWLVVAALCILMGVMVNNEWEYLKFRWTKWKYRKTFGPWMRWSLTKQERREILLNGWAQPSDISRSPNCTKLFTIGEDKC